MAKTIDLTGHRFGKLVVMERCGSINSRAMWKCVCDCGGTRIVCGRNLRNGSAVDCGCSNAVANEDGEIWKPVVGYEGMYEVSNHGRVKSCKRYRSGKRGAQTLVGERLLIQSYDHRGYLKVSLRDGSSNANYSVHQLVAKAFIPNPNGYEQLNHIDENKENNNVDNLEWCTQKYNNSYGTRLERCAKSKGKPVVGTNGTDVLHFDSARHASRELGIDPASITAACKGRVKTAGGFSWQYERKVDA